MYSEFSAELDCLIMPIITEQLSQLIINTDSWNIPTELNLDPSFHTPGTIDIFRKQFLLDMQRTENIKQYIAYNTRDIQDG